MTFPSEYHNVVKYPVQSPIAALLVLGMLSLLLVSVSRAQSSAAASSSSGHAASAAPSVPAGSSTARIPAKSGAASPTKTPPSNSGSHGNNNRTQPTNTGQIFYYYPYLYAVPVPYPLDISDNGPSEDDPNYQGGPTVFDRRGSGPASYIPPVSASPDQNQVQNQIQNQDHPDAAQDAPAADSNSDSQTASEPTVLIFKDGHQLEIDNYAIVNQTLYDLTLGHPRKIALADLDLAATQKQNDDRGITFELPSSTQAN
jgi:hypothetical protein